MLKKALFFPLMIVLCFKLEAQFGKRTIHSSQSPLGQLNLIDIDNDNDLDVVTEEISWYENDGNGQFISKHIIADTLSQSLTFIYGDFDNDGDQDIASGYVDYSTGYPSDYIFFYENDGNGNFSTASVSNLNGGIGHFDNFHTGDVNGDGNLDLFFLSGFDNVVGYILGAGNGAFNSPSAIAFQPTLITPSEFTSFDFDNDGDLDVSIGDVVKTHVYKSNFATGSSTFTRSSDVYPFNLTFFTSGIHGLGHMDVDDDGWEDIIFVLRDGNSIFQDDGIYWQRNLNGTSFDSTRALSPVPGFPNTPSIDDVSNASYTDFDLDGDIDIIVLRRLGNASVSNNELGWIENLGGGNYAQYIRLSDRPGGNGVIGINSGDIDSDGDVDLILKENTPLLFENFLGSNYKYSGQIYYDANQNKQKDTNENPISFIKVSASPNGVLSYPNNGFYEITTDSGFHTIGFDSLPNWVLTTDSSSYHRQVNQTNLQVDSLDFGFFPSSVATDLNVSLSGAFPRCDQQVNYWINIRNEGTTNPHGRIALTLDDSVTFVSSVLPTDSIIGKTIYWHYDSLDFFAEMKFRVLVQMPDFNSTGDTIISTLIVDEMNVNNTVLSTATDSTIQEVRCSYDPNDKRVMPKGGDSLGYIVRNQILEYMIRFQNTGNDTAFNVIITDQLSSNIDAQSFEFISSSHPAVTSINKNGKIQFTFNDILLVDSNANEPESHGFIKFKVKPLTGLLPKTVIYNTANIYFDSNPAVITNTIRNTIECYTTTQATITSNSATTLMVSAPGNPSFQWYRNDTLISGQTMDTLRPSLSAKYTVELTDSNGCKSFSPPYIYFAVGIQEFNLLEARIFPNPFQEELTVQFKETIEEPILIELYDIKSQLIFKEQRLVRDQIKIEGQNLIKGTYLLRLTTVNEAQLLLVKKVIVQ